MQYSLALMGVNVEMPGIGSVIRPALQIAHGTASAM